MKGIFLDRDGVINKIIYHREIGIIDTPFTVTQFNLLDRVGEAIRIFNDLNYKVVVVSNQPGIAKNHHDKAELDKITGKMKSELMSYNATLDGIYYCLHHPEAENLEYKKICDCRKPKPGLLFNAARDLDIELDRSFMIGDSMTDIEAGIEANVETIMIGNLKCDLCRLMEEKNIKPAHIKKTLYEASLLIKEMES